MCEEMGFPFFVDFFAVFVVAATAATTAAGGFRDLGSVRATTPVVLVAVVVMLVMADTLRRLAGGASVHSV